MTTPAQRESLEAEALVTVADDPKVVRALPWASSRRSFWKRLFAGRAYLAAADLVILCVGIALTQRVGLGLIILSLAMVALFANGGLYGPRFTLSVLDELPSIAARVLIVGTLIGASEVFRDHKVTFHSEVKVTIWFFVLTVAVRSIVYGVIRHQRRAGRLQRRTLVVGAGQVGTALVDRLFDHPELGACPVGFLDDSPLTPANQLPAPLLGTQAVLTSVILDESVDVVIVAFGSMREARLVELIRTCHRHRCEIYFVPRLYEMQSHGQNDRVWGIPLIRLRRAAYRTIAWRFKRLFDVVVGAVALLLASPVFLACAIAVRLEGPGIFFRQLRVGVDGRPITVLKFRTLKPADEMESATTWNISHDERLTGVGRFLRKTSLDELPQIWSILRGDMSLVGPRPERPHFVDEFTVTYQGYSERHRVPVGLTGWAQVNGLRGDTSIQERAAFDNDYIENWSLWLDCKILLRTCVAVVRGSGG